MSVVALHEERAMAEASAWLARLQRDDVGEADGVEFDAWLAAAPDNAAAYRKTLAAWQAFDAVGPEILSEVAAQERRARLKSVNTRRWLVGAGGLAAAAALAVTILPSLMVQTTSYATGKGQHQRITLADGSVVDLNAETTLKVSLSGSKRQVVLGEGEDRKSTRLNSSH